MGDAGTARSFSTLWGTASAAYIKPYICDLLLGPLLSQHISCHAFVFSGVSVHTVCTDITQTRMKPASS
jgi:hypothetical protein